MKHYIIDGEGVLIKNYNKERLEYIKAVFSPDVISYLSCQVNKCLCGFDNS